MTDDLVAFIRARLDEDERIARIADDRGGCPPTTWITEPSRSERWRILREADDSMPIGYISNGRWEDQHITRHDPARVLRGVEAKRRIVDEYTSRHEDAELMLGPAIERQRQWEGLRLATRMVATEWSTHEDYRREWTP